MVIYFLSNPIEMPLQEILIARHGETDWNRNHKWQGLSDIPLNETGLSQALELGNSLRGEKVDIIYSSDLKRAHKTAEIVSGILGIDRIETDQRLRERFLGKFEGWKTEDVADYSGIPEARRRLLETDEAFADTLESIEPWESFRSRIWQTFNELSQRHEKEKALIVVHGGVMRAIYLSINPDYVGFPNFKNCEFIRAKRNDNGWSSEP